LRSQAKYCARAAALVGGTLAAASCSIHFVESPATPEGIEQLYSSAEDLTRLRWHVTDAASIRFELAQPGGWTPVDFSAAPYPSGSYGCDGGTCFQLVVRGQLAKPADSYLLRSFQGALGPFPAQVYAPGDAPAPPVKVTADLTSDDATIGVSIDDWLTAPGLTRTFAPSVWPDATGACADDPTQPDLDVTLAPAPSQSLPFSAPLTDAGQYCMRLRTAPPSVARASPPSRRSSPRRSSSAACSPGSRPSRRAPSCGGSSPTSRSSTRRAARRT
jgi:hypothetical protein